MLPQFTIRELGELFLFYLSLLANPAMANIKPINPMPVVMYAKLPAHEVSMQIANKRIAIPNPIFFIRLHSFAKLRFVFCFLLFLDNYAYNQILRP